MENSHPSPDNLEVMAESRRDLGPADLEPEVTEAFVFAMFGWAIH